MLTTSQSLCPLPLPHPSPSPARPAVYRAGPMRGMYPQTNAYLQPSPDSTPLPRQAPLATQLPHTEDWGPSLTPPAFHQDLLIPPPGQLLDPSFLPLSSFSLHIPGLHHSSGLQSLQSALLLEPHELCPEAEIITQNLLGMLLTRSKPFHLSSSIPTSTASRWR